MRPIPEIEYELALLQYIRTRGDVRAFLKATGKDMMRLTRTIDALLAKGYILKERSKLTLTESGYSYLDKLNKELGRKGMYSYLLPDYSVRRVPMSAEATYIPQYMIQRGGGPFSNSLVRGRSGESSGDNAVLFKHNK